MTQRINRQWQLASRPVGMVGERNFELVEEPVDEIGDGEYLVHNQYLAFEPAMRGWMEDVPSYVPPVQIGEVMRGVTTGKIVESNNSDFPVGSFVQGLFGWQDYAIGPRGMAMATLIPEGVPITWPLGVLGVTGLTAYFGLLDVGRPVAGDTVLVSGAAGATGSVAAQIAKIHDCRVVGIAGGPEKCGWLTGELGLDAAIDYKSEDVGARIAELCPAGVNVFFDNVGGDILDAALANLAQNARVVLCGSISGYNDEEPRPGPSNFFNLTITRSRAEGFIVLDYADRFPDAAAQLAEWVAAGRIHHKEDIQEGFENAPATFQRLFTGANTGKQILELT